MRMLRLPALTVTLLALAAGSAHAVVGGHDASPGAVITAGHCGSPTGEVIAIPIGWPGALIDVKIGSVTPGLRAGACLTTRPGRVVRQLTTRR